MTTKKKLLVFLGVVLFLVILAYDDEDLKKNGNEANNSPGSSISSPIEGGWETSSHSFDRYRDRLTGKTYGGGTTAEGYRFLGNGTFEYFIMSTGYGPGSKEGWLVTKGKYKINGDQIFFYDQYGSFTDTKYPSDSYKDEPTGDNTRKFELVFDKDTNETKLRVQDSLTYADGVIRYKNFFKQKTK